MKKFFVVLASLLMLWSTVAFCEMGPKSGIKSRHEGMTGTRPDMAEREAAPEDMMEHMLPIKELNISEEQKKTIENLTLEHKKFRIKKETEIKLARVDLVEILRRSNDFDATRVKIKEISALQLELKLSAIDIREKIFNTLTKEQQDKLPKIRAERKEMWMKKKLKERTEDN